MKREQREFLAVRFKTLYVNGWNELLAKLKQHGGEMIVPMSEPEDYARRLLKYGRLFDSTKLVLKEGQPSRCHQNASQLWAANENIQLVTGYALGDDKLWWQHSWAWNPGTGELIETTEPRSKYFGAIWNEHQALRFAFANVPEFQDPSKCTPRVVKCAYKVGRMVSQGEQAKLTQILEGDVKV